MKMAINIFTIIIVIVVVVVVVCVFVSDYILICDENK